LLKLENASFILFLDVYRSSYIFYDNDF